MTVAGARPSPRPRLPAALFAVVLVAAALSQLAGLGTGFVAEDVGFLGVAHDTLERDPGRLLRNFVDVDLEGPRFYRPLLPLTMAADLAVWGPWATGFQLTNLAMFALVCALWFALAHRLAGGDRGVAFAATVPFVLFPTHPEVASWITGRDDLFPAVGLLVAAWLAATGRGLRSAMPAAMLFAFLGKEWAVPAAVLPVCVRYLVIGGVDRRTRLVRAVRETIGVWGALAGYLLARWLVLGTLGGGYGGGANTTWSAFEFVRRAGWLVEGLLVPLPREDLGGIARAVVLGLVAGLLVSATIAAWRSRPAARPVLLVAGLLAGLGVLAHLPARFFVDEFRDARHLWASSFGPAAAVGLGLLAVGGRRPRFAAMLWLVVVAGFAVMQHRHRSAWLEAGAQTATLLAQVQAEVDRVAPGTTVEVLGVPSSWRGAHLGIALAATEPLVTVPEDRTVRFHGDLYLEHRGMERVPGLQRAVRALFDPAAATRSLLWDRKRHALVAIPAGSLPVVPHVRARGVLVTAADGTSRLGPDGPRVVGTIDSAAHRGGRVVEVRGSWRAGPDGSLGVEAAVAVEPTLRWDVEDADSAEATLRITGAGGAAYLLFLAADAAFVPLLHEGVLWTSAAAPALEGQLDADGTAAVALPRPAGLAMAPIRAQVVLLARDGTLTTGECLLLR